MKNFFYNSIKEMATVLLFFFSLTVFAQNHAIVYVNSELVTEQNKDSIVGDGISGKVSYDSQNRKLTLENAYIYAYQTVTSSNIRVESYGDFTIELIGDNTINGQSSLSIFTPDTASCRIIGPGSLSLNSSETALYLARVDTLFITESANVSLFSIVSGLYGACFTKVLVDQSSLECRANNVLRVSELMMNKSYIAYPESGYFDGENCTIVDADGTECDWFVISPGTVSVNDHPELPFSFQLTSTGVRIANIPQKECVQVYNMLGQQVIKDSSHSDVVNINLKPGFYIARVGKKTLKIIIP